MASETRFHHSPREGLPHIMVLNDGEHIHYPASPTDVFAVLEMLPGEVVRGIPIIDFRLVDESSDESVEEGTDEFPPTRHDPFTDRLGIEIIPGVFTSVGGGSIYSPTRRIVLTADVYDPAIPDRKMWELFLRFRKLSTLTHEVGHHAHFSSLRHSGLVERSAAEQQAEMLACQWTDQIVIPYLHTEYANYARIFEDWASEWAGHQITLNDLIEEPRALPDDPTVFAVCRLAPAWLIIPRLAYAVSEGKPREEIHEWFAGYMELRQIER